MAATSSFDSNPPRPRRAGRRTLRNEDDGIYRESGGQTLVVPTAEGEGYHVSFAVGVDRGAPAVPAGGGPGGPPPRRPDTPLPGR